MSQEPSEVIEVLRSMGNFAILIWAVFILMLSGMVSIIAWLNSHMPTGLYSKLAIVWFDGVLLATITALYLGDAFLNGEVTASKYILYILVSAIGGAPLLRKIVSASRSFFDRKQ